MIKIEKNIPMPEVVRRGAPKYPFADMKVGESFPVPGKADKTTKARAVNAVWSFIRRRKTPARFRVAIIKNHEGKDEVRVWRTGDVKKRR